MTEPRPSDPATLQARARSLEERLRGFAAEGLALDLTRGKPSAAQLDLLPDFDGVLEGDYRCEDGSDARNYGALDGIPELKRLFAEYLGVGHDEVLAGGNSSLQLMYLYVLWALEYGPDGERAWRAGEAVRFLCPVPGYDRHHALCEELRIEMLPVPMTATGPDMDVAERLVASDRAVRGMWCVPKYSNPGGITYGDDEVRRIARLALRAGPGFRVMWDNAYAVHDLVDAPPVLANVLDAARAEGTEDSIVMFGSTSKISFAGAGIAFMGATRANLDPYLQRLSLMTIGPDKVNQLRHARYFRDMEGIRAHMRRHAAILRPKFECVLGHLDAGLGGKGLARWTRPEGGYFVSFEGLPETASRIVALAGEHGVRLTPAGAAFPYGRDPEDRHIRIAPTFPTLAELDKAMEVFVACAELISVRRLLRAND